MVMNPAADAPTTLVDGTLEGWARVRISGQTEWHQVWLVVQAGVADYDPDEQPPPAPAPAPALAIPTAPVAVPISITKKKRLSNVFSFQTTSTDLPPLPRRLISMYDSPKAKHKKKPPLFTMATVRQAYAVYPERPELIQASSLIKVVGVMGDEAWVTDKCRRKGDDGFMLILTDGGSAEMVKWIVALHDAFELYGRPKAWNWDVRDPVSLFFGYPVGSQKAVGSYAYLLAALYAHFSPPSIGDQELFLDRVIAEAIDPREDRMTKYHAELKKLLKKHKFPSSNPGQ
jgi:CCR4-NOT transcriptional complex subunit CAF120